MSVVSDPVFDSPVPSSSEPESGAWSDLSMGHLDSMDHNPGDEAQTRQVERLQLPISLGQGGNTTIPPWLEQVRVWVWWGVFVYVCGFVWEGLCVFVCVCVCVCMCQLL